MLKFTLRSDDNHRVTIGIGLTQADIEHLKQHGPQTFPLSTLSLAWPLEIRVQYADTETKLMEDLAPLVGPETKVEGR